MGLFHMKFLGIAVIVFSALTISGCLGSEDGDTVKNILDLGSAFIPCDKVPVDQQAHCLYSKALRDKDSSVCDKIEGDMTAAAGIGSDLEVKNAGVKNQCLYDLAILKGDRKLCDRLEASTVGYSTTSCLHDLAEADIDIRLCQELGATGPSRKGYVYNRQNCEDKIKKFVASRGCNSVRYERAINCIISKAIIDKNPSYCDEIYNSESDVQLNENCKVAVTAYLNPV